MGVSRGVSSRVSRGVSFESDDDQSSGTDAAEPTRRGVGAYLARSGTAYLFQIRLPKELGGGRGIKPIRIGLGACPAREARRLADLLAAEARLRFAEIGKRTVSGKNKEPTSDAADDLSVTPEFSGDTPEEAMAEVRGYLKAYKRIIGAPAPAPSGEQLRAFEGYRGLVTIAREIEKGSDGNPVIVEQADLLKARYVEKLSGTALPPAPTSAPSPFAVPAAPIMPAVVAPIAIEASPLPSVHHAQPMLDNKGNRIAAFLQDRRSVPRPPSAKPLFSEVSEDYLGIRASAKGAAHKTVGISRFRRDLFIELIGDHPVDVYEGADIQAFVELLRFWPGNKDERRVDWTARQIIDDNRDFHLQPLKRKTPQEGYVADIRAMMRFRMSDIGYRDPFGGVRIIYPDTAAAPVKSQPLSTEKISAVFRVGVESGVLDNAMLPLLGHLTGRRLGLLIHLRGCDISEKYPGIWTAQMPGVIRVDNVWKPVPFKTEASLGFFVLHQFLTDIGFVQWAMAQGEAFLFPNLMNLVDPSKSTSSYMGRLFRRAGVLKSRKEVFHSLRGGQIDDMRNQKIDGRDRRLQAGHALGDDEHDNYGFSAISEKNAYGLAHLPLDPTIDYSVFRGLNFDRLAGTKRKAGRHHRKTL